jgi:hypothetical protein
MNSFIKKMRKRKRETWERKRGCLSFIQRLSFSDPWVSGCPSPGVYRIRVRGLLDEGVLRQLDGLSVTLDPSPDGIPESVLVARVADQAALSGLLNALYEFHLPLISVDCLDVEET